MNCKEDKTLKTVVVIPRLNGGDKLYQLVVSISNQSHQPYRRL